jgi:hypothetical protein
MTQQTETSPATIVADADRDAANEWADNIGRLGGVYLDSGQREGLSIAFAAHRIASTAELKKYAREASVMLVSLLGGGSEWFKRIGDEYYVCPKLAGDELQRRKIDAINTKKDLVHEKASNAEMAEALDSLITAVKFEVPPIIDGVQAVSRARILLECAEEARAVLAKLGGQ